LCAFALALVVIAFLLSVLLFVYKNPTKPIYFATNNVGQLIDIVPVTQPNMSTEEVIVWATHAVEETYSYDYINYRRQLQKAQRYFTNYGWSAYIKALRASNNLVALKERKMIVIAKVVGTPKLINEGLLRGGYAWQFDIPVLVTYMLPPYDEGSGFANALDVRIIIQRQSVLQSFRGLGIVQIVSNFASGGAPSQEISATPSG
jgi:intracellular multiplication protein IcmL